MNLEKTNFSNLHYGYHRPTDSPSLWYLGYELIWGKKFSRSVVVLEKNKKRIKKIIKFIFWAIVYLGYLSLGLWLYFNHQVILADPTLLLTFWLQRDPLILIFLLTTTFNLFLVYKNSEARVADNKINYRKFSDSRQKKTVSKRIYNVSLAYGPKITATLGETFLLARRLGQKEITSLHLFRVLLQDKEIQALMIRLDVDIKRLVELIDTNLLKRPETGIAKEYDFNQSLKKILIQAFVEAHELQQPNVDVLNLLNFSYAGDAWLIEILYELEIDQDKIHNAVAWFRVNKKMLSNYRKYRKSALLKPDSGMNRSYTAISTPTLDHFSHDLTVQSKYNQTELCVAREQELKSIFDAFLSGQNGIILSGPIGVGKRTIINGLSQLMVEEKVPDFLKDKRLVELDVSRLISGANPAQAQERLLVMINEIGRSGNIVLYIDNIENLIGVSAGTQESLDLSEVLAEALKRNHLRCLASATEENYHRYIENQALGSVMTRIKISEPEFNEAVQILESKVGSLEAKYDIFIVYSALEQAVKMSKKYLHERSLPAKAIDLLEKAALITRQRAQNNPEQSSCSGEEVAIAIGELTGIPVNKISIDESQKLLNLEAEIHQRLIGQEEAVKAVAASLRRARVQLKGSNRPIASFLFMGPTGVGKTELAKAVSDIYFGAEDYLIRIDMSEYQGLDSIKKMIGDPDGTLGYLTEAVRKKPFSLILFDEIEKANPDILNLFLQLLDDGRLTDGQGRTINFTESIIIATSNIGALYIQQEIKAQTKMAEIRQELIDNHLNKHLRPELINRFDGIIVFKPLSPENVEAIATIMLKQIKKNLELKGVGLKADKKGVKVLAKKGYDPKFGARPLRRLLQDEIENEIAVKFLSGELKRRDTIMINQRGRLEIEPAKDL